MSSAELKARARSLIIHNAKKTFAVSLAYLLIVTFLYWLLYRLPGRVDIQSMYDRLSGGEIFGMQLLYRKYRPLGVVAAVLAYVLLRPVIDIFLINYCLKTARGELIANKAVFINKECALKGIAIFLYTLSFVAIWSLLLVIPGIVAAYRYRLSYYILLDDPSKKPLQCIDESANMMKGGKLDLFAIDLSFLGWYFLDYAIVFVAILTLFQFVPRIMLLWLMPYRGMANAGYYEYRKREIAV